MGVCRLIRSKQKNRSLYTNVYCTTTPLGSNGAIHVTVTESAVAGPAKPGAEIIPGMSSIVVVVPAAAGPFVPADRA